MHPIRNRIPLARTACRIGGCCIRFGIARNGFGLTAVSLAATIHAVDPDPLDLSLLNSQSAIVTTRFGTDLRGDIVDIREDSLAIRNSVDAGEVIYTVERSDIASITLPGEALVDYAQRMWNEGNRELMIPVMEALYRQRGPLLAFLPERDAVFFITLVNAYLAAEQPVDAIATAQRLRPFIRSPQARRRIDEAIILGHVDLQLYADARDLALDWVNHARSFETSALGWWILGRIALHEGDYENALEFTLHPVVFSGPLPVDYLGHCYDVAIAASRALGEDHEAALLESEMAERGFRRPAQPDATPSASGQTPR